jgi:hypothetical protein
VLISHRILQIAEQVFERGTRPHSIAGLGTTTIASGALRLWFLLGRRNGQTVKTVRSIRGVVVLSS